MHFPYNYLQEWRSWSIAVTAMVGSPRLRGQKIILAGLALLVASIFLPIIPFKDHSASLFQMIFYRPTVLLLSPTIIFAMSLAVLCGKDALKVTGRITLALETIIQIACVMMYLSFNVILLVVILSPSINSPVQLEIFLGIVVPVQTILLLCGWGSPDKKATIRNTAWCIFLCALAGLEIALLLTHTNSAPFGLWIAVAAWTLIAFGVLNEILQIQRDGRKLCFARPRSFFRR